MFIILHVYYMSSFSGWSLITATVLPPQDQIVETKKSENENDIPQTGRKREEFNLHPRTLQGPEEGKSSTGDSQDQNNSQDNLFKHRGTE